MKQSPWIDRTFAFDLPPGAFPGVIERLRGTPVRLEERVASLPPEILTQKIDGKWSIQEHVGHLVETENLHYGRMQDFVNGLPELRPADPNNPSVDSASYNSASIENLLDAFRGSRMRLVGLLEGFDEAMIVRTSLHPRLKVPMRVIDSSVFMAEHDDHHLSRITEIIRKILSTT